MRRRSSLAVLIVVALVLMAGCAAGQGSQAPSDPDKLHVVTTFTVLKDIVAAVGGDRVAIHSMVPMGTDPHEYQPLPLDLAKATEADVLFWNGLDMETGDGWFAALVEVAGKSFDGEQVFELAAGITPQYLTDGDEVEVNPHAFVSPQAGMIYTRNALAALQSVDPNHAETYAAKAAAFLAELEALDARYVAELGAFPPDERIIVTAERAFQYVAADYGLTEGYLFQIDTEDTGTPEQIRSLVDFIRSHPVRGILAETNIDRRPLESVSRDTGVPIVGEIYSDELGPPGSPGETYLQYLAFNLEMMVKAMRGGD